MSLHLQSNFKKNKNLIHAQWNDPNKSLKQQKVKIVIIYVLNINGLLGLHNFDLKNS